MQFCIFVFAQPARRGGNCRKQPFYHFEWTVVLTQTNAMYKRICIFILLLFYNICYSQNLVLNPDFETYSQCPNNVDGLGYAVPWFNPAVPLNISSPDYFNQCTSNPWIYVPDNWLGYQNAHSGVGYGGAIMIYYQYSNFREYLEVPLVRALDADSCYHFEMYMNLANVSKYATGDVGVYFSDTLIDNFATFPLPFVPQIINNTGFITDTLNWTLISGDYTATGGESYIIIGNFKNDNNTTTVIVDSTAIWINAYYYFDDVSLIRIPTCNTGINEQNENIAANLFPNPVIDKLNVSINNNELSEIIIYSIASQILFQQKFTNSTTINTEQLAKGLYIYEVRSRSGLCKKGKFVKD